MWPSTSNVDTSKSQAPDSIQHPKYGRGRPPKRANSDSCGQPPSKVLKLSTFSNSPSTDEPCVHSNINIACIHLLQRVQQLLGASPQSVLTTTLSLNSIQEVIHSLNGMHEAFEVINARRMRTSVTVLSLSVCLLPLYCVHKVFMNKIERTSQFCAELQRFSTKGFR